MQPARVSLNENVWPEVEYFLEMSVLEEGADGVDRCLRGEGGRCLREKRLPPRVLTDDERSALFAVSTRVATEKAEGRDPFCPIDDRCIINVFTWKDWMTLRDHSCDVPRVPRELAREMIDLLENFRREGVFLENGDTNGDGSRDISDAIGLLGWLFLGAPGPVDIECPLVLPCPSRCRTRLENGDTNGDREIDVSDAIHLLGWLFSGGPSPEPICDCLEFCEGVAGREVVVPLLGVSRPEDIRALQAEIIRRLRERFLLGGEGVEPGDCPSPGDLCDAYILGLWTHEPAIAMAVINGAVLQALGEMEEVGEIRNISEEEGG